MTRNHKRFFHLRQPFPFSRLTLLVSAYVLSLCCNLYSVRIRPFTEQTSSSMASADANKAQQLDPATAPDPDEDDLDDLDGVCIQGESAQHD